MIVFILPLGNFLGYGWEYLVEFSRLISLATHIWNTIIVVIIIIINYIFVIANIYCVLTNFQEPFCLH